MAQFVRNTNSEILSLVTVLFEQLIPFNRYLGMKARKVEEGLVELEVPFRKEFIGNPALPALHGGVVSALLDTAGVLYEQSRAGHKRAAPDE